MEQSNTTPDNDVTKPQTGNRKKRTIAELMALIPNPDSVIFEPLNPPKHQSILHLPSNTDVDDPYTLLSLFWPENMWSIISRNTNLYAITKRIESNDAYNAA